MPWVEEKNRHIPEGTFKGLMNEMIPIAKEFFRLVKIFISRLPIMIGSEELYWESYDTYGKETWWAPHNLWREVFHLCFGFIICLPFYFLPAYLLPPSVFLLAFYYEFSSDCDLSFKNWTMKSSVDVLAWTLGSFLYWGMRVWI